MKSLTAISTCVSSGSCACSCGTRPPPSARPNQQEEHDRRRTPRTAAPGRAWRSASSAQLLAVLGVVGQALQHRVEVPGLLAGRDRGAVDLGERTAGIPRGRRPAYGLPSPSSARPAACCARAASRSAARPRAAPLPAAGRTSTSVASWRVTSARSAAPSRAGTKLNGRRRARALLRGRPPDRDRQQSLLAQQLAHLPGRVALDDALALAARGIHRGVFEGAHGSVLARDPQDFLDGRDAREHLGAAIVADARACSVRA